MTNGGWRRELLTHGPMFLSWIEREEILNRVFTRLADDLEGFLLNQLDSQAAAEAFVAAIPDVTGRCNEDIYDRPLRAEAYAFIHLLSATTRMADTAGADADRRSSPGSQWGPRTRCRYGTSAHVLRHRGLLRRAEGLR